jgi:hypothetical protein
MATMDAQQIHDNFAEAPSRAAAPAEPARPRGGHSASPTQSHSATPAHTASMPTPPAFAMGARRQREPQPDRAEYLPKGVAITSGPNYLAAVAAEINDRPRKIHDWRKPSEVFAELLETDASTA